MLLCSSSACFCSLTCFNVFAIDSAMSVPHVRTLPNCPFSCHFVHLCAKMSIFAPFAPPSPRVLLSLLIPRALLPLPSGPVFVLFERDPLYPPSLPDFSPKTPLPLAYVTFLLYLCTRLAVSVVTFTHNLRTIYGRYTEDIRTI